MEKGFIKLNRKSFAHKFWTKARVLSEFEAWIDLIQSARYDEAVKIEYIDGREIKYGRGQYPASIRFLAKRWTWGEQKVRTFLSELKKDGSITTDSLQGMNVITLCKYDKYNSGEYAENTANNTPENTDISLILKELQELKTQVVTHHITQLQHSDNTNSNKEKKEERINTSSSNELPCETSQPHIEGIDYKKLVDFFNSETKGIFGIVKYPISDIRKGHIRARIREHGKDVFISAIHKAFESDFLKGANNKGFKATFDWIIKPTNFEKILSNNYDNKLASIGNNSYVNQAQQTAMSLANEISQRHGK